MEDPVRAFYDAFAGSYHPIFAGWRTPIAGQAGVLDRLLREGLGDGPLANLDRGCGIGAQALGLARLGHRATAAELRSAAVARAEREAAAPGCERTFGVADLRESPNHVSGTFDAVIACDDALPHLLDDADLRRATAGMAVRLRPGGLLASIRDYDRLVQERPRTESPRINDDAEGRRIAFQVWDWADDGSG